MATQRLTVATLAGESANQIVALFRAWAERSDAETVDRFCEALRENGLSLPVVYFCEWADHWLMGDLVPGPGAVNGRRYQAACLSPKEAVAWAERCGRQFPEQEWLVIRLREAVSWQAVASPLAVVVLRFVIGPTTTDEDVRQSLEQIPDWLAFAPSACLCDNERSPPGHRENPP